LIQHPVTFVFPVSPIDHIGLSYCAQVHESFRLLTMPINFVPENFSDETQKWNKAL